MDRLRERAKEILKERGQTKPYQVPELRTQLINGIHSSVDSIFREGRFYDAAYLKYFAQEVEGFSMGWIGQEISDESMIAVEDFNIDGIMTNPKASWSLAEAMPSLNGFVVLEAPTIKGLFATPIDGAKPIEVGITAISWYVEGETTILFQLYTNSDSADIDSLVDSEHFRMVSEFAIPFMATVTRDSSFKWMKKFGVPGFKIPHHQSLLMFIGNLFIIASSSKVTESITETFLEASTVSGRANKSVQIIRMKPRSNPASKANDRSGNRKRGIDHRYRVRAHLRWIQVSRTATPRSIKIERRPTYVRGHLRGAEGMPIIETDRVMKWIWN